MALMITKNDINRVYGTPYTPAPKITKGDLDTVYGTPPSYTDIQRNALSRPIKQTKTNTQKYGTVNGKTVLPYSIENQGLYTSPTGEKNNMTALLEGTALGGSNHIKNTANIADTIKAYTTVAGQTYKDTEPLFYDVNKSNQLGDILKSKQQQYGAGSQFRNDIVQKIKDREETQKLWTQQVYDNHKDVKYGDKIIGLSQGLTSVLPYMAVSALTGSPQTARATMGIGTFGNAIGEAIGDDATLEKASGYALSQAGKEMATQKLVGGMPFFKDGLINANAITDKYISNELIKWLINRGVDITGEGVEEAISTYLTPYLKRTFYAPNTSNATKEQLWNSFKGGAGVSAVLGIANNMGIIVNQSDFNKADSIYRAYANAVDKENGLSFSKLKGENIQPYTDIAFDKNRYYNKNIGNIIESDDIESLSLRFISNRDNLYRNLDNVEEIEGYEDISCHADPYTFGFVDPETGDTIQELEAEEFARIVKESGKYKGGKIRLISCQSGALDAGLAQEFADAMGTTVLAPTKTVFTNSQGYMVLSDSKEEAVNLLRKAKEKWTPQGWKEFKPRGQF